MKVLLLGATGGCGRWALRLAGERGHEITALTRDAAPLAGFLTERARLVLGSPLESEQLPALLEECGAVVCCLGMKRRHPANPWSEIVSPPRFMERVAERLVAAADGRPLRLVAISAAGVAESAPVLPWIMKFLVARSNVGVMYRDLGAMERVFSGSSLAWEAARPVALADGPPTGRAVVTNRFGMTSRIRRSDVAQWLIDALDRPPDPRQRTPLLGSR